MSNHERAKASRYRRDADRTRYVASHSMLRLVLSRYVGVEPSSLTFSVGAQGKPQLEGDSNFPIFFNLSHSGDLALLAVSGDRAVGVDIEEIKGDVDVPALALAVLSDSELRVLRAAPAGAQRPLFFSFWVRKEAVLKGCGLGLTVQPRCVVALTKESKDDIGFFAVTPSPDPAEWGVCDLDIDDRYAGAVAAPGQDWVLRCFEHRWLDKNPASACRLACK